MSDYASCHTTREKVVYLAGPINGCTDDEANNWRDVVKDKVGADNCLDPMRRDYRGIEDQSVNEIVIGDLTDINDSDVMLANCWQVSWGTAMEIHYAHGNGLRVIVIIPEGTRISPWLRYHSDAIVHNIDEALALL